jgi:hypothetical protein
VSVTIFLSFSQKSLQQIWWECLKKNISETNESFESKFGRNVWKKIYLKPMSHLKTNLAGMFIGWFSTK